MIRRLAIGALLLGLTLSIWPPDAEASVRFKLKSSPVRRDSGRHDGSGATHREAYTTTIESPGAPIMRVIFSAANLGAKSFVTLRSVRDAQVQRLDSKSLAEWGMASGLFNGDKIEITLHVAPEDRSVFIVLGEFAIAEPEGVDTQCGAVDDRVASGDNRVGRVNGNCTAWRIGNGALLTAGHCVDFDPDNAGSMLPDGTLDWGAGTAVEFNVPASDSSGNLVAAALADQYPVILTGIQWRFDGVGQGLGKDWALFRVGPNPITGLLPHQVYGIPFRITRETPAVNVDIRLTGFGSDTGPANATNQTSTGPFLGETFNGADVSIAHRADSEGGNSGGPIIWEANGLAIGVHTNAGCTTGATGNNSGTSFEVDPLEAAINAAPGPNTTYVDGNHPLVPAIDGTLMRPHSSFLAGYSAAVSGGRLSVFAGTYGVPTPWTATTPMTIEAPAGPVTVGTP